MWKSSFILEQHSYCKLFRTTKYYLYFNLLQMLISIGLVVTALLTDQQKAFPLEVAVCLLLFSDIIIRFLSDGQFLEKVSNKIDLTLLVLVVALIVLQWIGGSVYEPLAQLGQAVFVIRYGFQIYRIFSLVRQSRELRQLQQMGEITMGEIDITDDTGNYELYREIQNKV